MSTCFSFYIVGYCLSNVFWHLFCFRNILIISFRARVIIIFFSACNYFSMIYQTFPQQIYVPFKTVIKDLKLRDVFFLCYSSFQVSRSVQVNIFHSFWLLNSKINIAIKTHAHHKMYPLHKKIKLHWSFLQIEYNIHIKYKQNIQLLNKLHHSDYIVFVCFMFKLCNFNVYRKWINKKKLFSLWRFIHLHCGL